MADSAQRLFVAYLGIPLVSPRITMTLYNPPVLISREVKIQPTDHTYYLQCGRLARPVQYRMDESKRMGAYILVPRVASTCAFPPTTAASLCASVWWL